MSRPSLLVGICTMVAVQSGELHFGLDNMEDDETLFGHGAGGTLDLQAELGEDWVTTDSRRLLQATAGSAWVEPDSYSSSSDSASGDSVDRSQIRAQTQISVPEQAIPAPVVAPTHSTNHHLQPRTTTTPEGVSSESGSDDSDSTSVDAVVIEVRPPMEVEVAPSVPEEGPMSQSASGDIYGSSDSGSLSGDGASAAPPMSARASMPATYNCRTRERWSPEKSAFCCSSFGLGCPPAPAPVTRMMEEPVMAPVPRMEELEAIEADMAMYGSGSGSGFGGGSGSGFGGGSGSYATDDWDEQGAYATAGAKSLYGAGSGAWNSELDVLVADMQEHMFVAGSGAYGGSGVRTAGSGFVGGSGSAVYATDEEWWA